MRLLDKWTGADAAREQAAKYASALAESQALASRQSQLLDHYTARVAETDTELIRLKQSGPFVGGQWKDLSGATTQRQADIIKAREGYLDRYTDNAGILRRFGTSRRIVDMHAEYAFGGGLEAPSCGDEAIDEVISEWWTYHPNQEAAFDMDAQHRTSARLLVDGALYFALFEASPGRPMLVRLLDPLQIGAPVTHPDDADKVLYHTRKYTPQRYNPKTGEYQKDAQPRTVYYQDIDMMAGDEYDDPFAEAFGDNIAADKRGRPVKVLKAQWGGLSPTDAGTSMMLALMQWELQFLGIAEDQVTISAATAALAAWMKVKGGQSQVNAAAAHFGQTGDTASTSPRNAGNMNVTNDAADFSFNRASVGAVEANQTRRMLQMQQAAIGGVALHYIGDPENANLATATAMEGPVLKHFLSYQGRWTYIYTRLAKEAIIQAGKSVEELSLNVPMPDLVTPDLMDRMDAIGFMLDRGLATKAQASREAWTAMGAADVTAEVDEAVGEEEEEPEQPEQPAGMPWPVAAPPEGESANPEPAE